MVLLSISLLFICVDNGIFDEMYSDHTSSGICLLFTIMYGRKGVVDAYFQIYLLDFLIHGG